MEEIEFNVLRRRSALKDSQFLTIEHLAHHDLEIEKLSKVFGASPTIHTYATKASCYSRALLSHFAWKELFCSSS